MLITRGCKPHYATLNQLWLRKVFLAIVNVSSNVPKKRVKMILSKRELPLLPEDTYTCKDTYKRNMVSPYIIIPSGEVFNQLCYASFIKKYELLPKQLDNDVQLNELPDEVIEENHSVNNNNSYPKRITLSTGEKVVHGKVEFVLMYHVPNKHKDPEAYAHHLLFMFYPFCSEEQLKAGEPLPHSAKLLEAGVINVINENKSLVEPFSDMVDEAFVHFRSDLMLTMLTDVNNEYYFKGKILKKSKVMIFKVLIHHMLFQGI